MTLKEIQFLLRWISEQPELVSRLIHLTRKEIIHNHNYTEYKYIEISSLLKDFDKKATTWIDNESALQKVQNIIKNSIPSGTSLVDELLQERKREHELEDKM